jgi:hypothetical protein
LNLATNTPETVIVHQLRKIVPRPEVVPFVISSTCNGPILSCVIWNLLSLSGYYEDFKNSRMSKQVPAGKRKNTMLTVPQKV